MKEIKKIENRLLKEALSPRIVLGKCQLVDSLSKESPAFSSANNLPLYYYLGNYLPRNSVLNLGFGLGLPLSFYLLSCRAKVLAQHYSEDFYSPRLGIGNVKRMTNIKIPVFVGETTSEEFVELVSRRKWGTVIINSDNSIFEKLTADLFLVWEFLDDDGFICLDYSKNKINTEIIENFRRLVNRPIYNINSRYGHTLLFKGT